MGIMNHASHTEYACPMTLSDASAMSVCRGRECAAWSDVSADIGYCGMAGRPTLFELKDCGVSPTLACVPR